MTEELLGGVAAPATRPVAVPVHLASVTTGVPRLDQLLGGGYPGGASTLLYGAPFTGKQVLQMKAAAAALGKGIPCTYILHGVGAEAMSARLAALDPTVAAAERAGLLTYVDAHSQFLGESTRHPNAIYLPDPHDAAALATALPPHAFSGLVILQSVSTVIVDLGQARALQFLRSTLGRVHRAGGAGLLALHAGMHLEPEVQMVKSLCGGMLELRKRGDTLSLHVEGLETTVPRPGWVEYEASRTSFRVTGSFTVRAIR